MNRTPYLNFNLVYISVVLNDSHLIKHQSYCHTINQLIYNSLLEAKHLKFMLRLYCINIVSYDGQYTLYLYAKKPTKNKEFYQHTLANTGTLRASDMDNF